MDSIVNRLFREGTRRGLAGSRGWTTVAVATGAVRVMRRVRNPKPDVVWRQAMRPGDRFQVTVMEPPPTRRQRRKAKKPAGRGRD